MVSRDGKRAPWRRGWRYVLEAFGAYEPILYREDLQFIRPASQLHEELRLIAVELLGAFVEVELLRSELSQLDLLIAFGQGETCVDEVEPEADKSL